MSIKVSTYVWEYSEHTSTALLLMLAIADHAHDDGGGAYPSIDTLARKARTTRRHVKRLLHILEASGELEVKRGRGPRGTNLYQVTISHPRFNDGSNDGLGDAQVTPKGDQVSPPAARGVTPSQGYDLEEYLQQKAQRTSGNSL